MEAPKVKVCWFCQQIYSFSRTTSRYCSDICRVKDNQLCQKQIDEAISDLKRKQITERQIKSGKIWIEYIEKYSEDKDN